MFIKRISLKLAMRISLEKKGKNAQVTIFIILAIVIVSAIVLVSFLYIKPLFSENAFDDPQLYVQKCIEPIVKEKLDKINSQGGYFTPDKFLTYKNTKVQYHCYTSQDKQLCINYEPNLKSQIENELYINLIGDVETCFENFKKSLKNYDYSEENLEFAVSLVPDKIKFNITKKITVSKAEQTKTISDFSFSLNDPTYDFIRLENRIVNDEVNCNCPDESCSADVLEISKENNDYEIYLFISGNNEKVYSLKDVNTGRKFMFSVRNCVRLP
jgi:hypothetical protein